MIRVNLHLFTLWELQMNIFKRYSKFSQRHSYRQFCHVGFTDLPSCKWPPTPYFFLFEFFPTAIREKGRTHLACNSKHLGWETSKSAYILYQWFSARLRYPECWHNENTTVLHYWNDWNHLYIESIWCLMTAQWSHETGWHQTWRWPNFKLDTDLISQSTVKPLI